MSKLFPRRFLALAGFFVAPVMAEPKPMTIPLSGAAEIPPKGSAMFSYDPATRNLSWTVEFSDLSGPATMAHFHGPAMPGKNAPPVLWIVEKGVAPVSPIRGSAVLTPEQAKDFIGGSWYLNIHTSTNPSGEIRGLVPAN